MNIQESITPPFSTIGGVSNIPVKPKNISNKAWDKYLEVYNFAKQKGNENPKKFADDLANKSNWFKNETGKNNFTNETVNKSEPGKLTKNGKYKNFNSIQDGLENYYNITQTQPTFEQPVQNNNFELPQQIQQQEQQIESLPNLVQSQTQPINIPNNVNSLDIEPNINQKVASDQFMNYSNPIESLEQTNPRAYGGNLNSYEGGGNLNEYRVGGTHEINPLGGIPQGFGANGKPNTVEEGETSFNINGSKFIFSNRITI